MLTMLTSCSTSYLSNIGPSIYIEISLSSLLLSLRSSITPSDNINSSQIHKFITNPYTHVSHPIICNTFFSGIIKEARNSFYCLGVEYFQIKGHASISLILLHLLINFFFRPNPRDNRYQSDGNAVIFTLNNVDFL